MKKNNQKGVILLFSVLFLSLIAGVSLGMAGILLNEVKISRNIGNSVVALHAAGSGIETALKLKDNFSEICSSLGCCEESGFFCNVGTSGAKYFIRVYETGEGTCSSETACVQSIGIYRGVRRGLEVDY